MTHAPRRFAILLTLLTAGLAAHVQLAAQTPAAAPAAPAVAAAPVPITAADAKPLLGDWTIAAEGPQGAITMLLTLKADGEKTVGEISSDAMAPSTITEIYKAGNAILLQYSFDYQGSAVPAVVTLTPAGETLNAVFDFADGAFTMPAVATRKKS
jgi:hypothetical protein